MKQQKLIRAKLVENVYRRHVNLLCTPDRGLAGKWFKRLYGDEWAKVPRTTRGRTMSADDQDEFHVWIADKDNIGILAHELIHVTVQTLWTRSVHVDIGGDEPMAYLYQCLMHQALHALGHGKLSW